MTSAGVSRNQESLEASSRYVVGRHGDDGREEMVMMESECDVKEDNRVKIEERVLCTYVIGVETGAAEPKRVSEHSNTMNHSVQPAWTLMQASLEAELGPTSRR